MRANLKISYRDKVKPPRYVELEKALSPLAQDTAFRWSFNGVPHLLVEVNSVVYSICYFRTHDSWRVFYPYQQGEQKRLDFKSIADVTKFFKEVKKHAKDKIHTL